MPWAAFVLLFTACQEPEITKDITGKASGKPIITIGNGNRLFITTTTTWTSNNIYVLDGEVIVRGTTLTIQPGTVIMGKEAPSPNSNLNSSLIIDTNAQLFAQGTPSSPIVFTSDQPVETREPGDWGGVTLLGSGVINANRAKLEGLLEPISYGGSGDNRPQGSGILQYVRIEFAGNSLRNGGSSNGLTLAGVGSNTIVDHIQVSFSREDAFEFLGGTVNGRFLVSWKCRDDDFDTELGHTGIVQYAVSRRSSRGSSFGSNGIETENDSFGTTSTPKTNTLFANITFLGPGELEGDGSEISVGGVRGFFNAGALIRRRSATNLLNSIITAWPIGIEMRDDFTAQNYLAPRTPHDSLRLRGISVGLLRNGGTPFFTSNMDITVAGFVSSQYTSLGNNSAQQAVVPITNVADVVGLRDQAFGTGTASNKGTNPAGQPDLTLLPSTANLTNAATLPSDAIRKGLVQENFRGAFDTDGIVTDGNWHLNTGWLEFDPENAVYH